MPHTGVSNSSQICAILSLKDDALTGFESLGYVLKVRVLGWWGPRFEEGAVGFRARG